MANSENIVNNTNISTNYKSEYSLIHWMTSSNPCFVTVYPMDNYVPTGEDIGNLFQYHKSLSDGYRIKGYDMKYKWLCWLEDRTYDPTNDMVIEQTHKAQEHHIEYYKKNQFIRDLFEANIMATCDHLIIFTFPSAKRKIYVLHSDKLWKTMYENETNFFVKFRMMNRTPFWIFEGDDFPIPDTGINDCVVACYAC
jgi:hypothetical protein